MTVEGKQATLAVTVSTIEFVSIDAGSGHTCGVTTDGLLYCWGRNWFGELGVGTTTDAMVPMEVPIDGVVSMVTKGTWHTCALTTAGSTYCWGLSSQGQLGHDSSTEDALTPALVVGSR